MSVDLATVVLDSIESDPSNLARLRALLGVDALPTSPVSEWLTVAEAADHMRCSRKRVYDLTGQRRIAFSKDGSRTLLRRRDVDAYLAESAQAVAV